jgi:hypothetical protein
MDKEEFLKKEAELYEIFHKFCMSKEILKCGTYKTVCETFYKKCNKDLMKLYESLEIGERSGFVDLEVLFKQILFGCDDRSSAPPIEEQLYKALWEYIKIKIEYFENKTSLFVDVVFFKICNFVELCYEREFSVKKLFLDLNKKIDEYFEKKMREDEVIGGLNKGLIKDILDQSEKINQFIKENPDRTWVPNTEENRKMVEEENMFKPEWKVPNDKIVIISTPYGENSFYKQFLKSKVSVKERNEKICEDDLLNLEIAFNTAKSFEEFLNLI